MGYVNKYYSGWGSPNNLQGYLYIDLLDYSGGAEELKMLADSLVITYAFDDWNNPIMGVQCEFQIQNDRTDFYALLPLLTAEEREWKIRVVVIAPTSYTLFEGFLNCDTVSQKYLNYQPIKFAASSYLMKLENRFAPSIEILQNMTFINIIDEILRITGAEYNIRINSKLHAEGDILSGAQTLFNKNGFYTELFWEDEVVRTSCLDILKAILTSFDCYIYWWRGYWYIERYEDIWTESLDFVEYVTGQTYLPISSGSNYHVLQSILDVHSLVFTGQSQTLNVIPGLKTIKITLTDKRVFNLVLSSLKDAIPMVETVPAPDYRTFKIYQEQTGDLYSGDIVWLYAGLPKSNIANAIQRIQRNTAHPTDPLIIPSYRGLSTCFKITVDKADVSINIKFTYFLDLTTRTGWTQKWTDYNINFYWFLRIAGRNDYIINSADLWLTKLGDSGGVIDDVINGVMQVTNIAGSSFDTGAKSVQVSITIPIGLVTAYLDGHPSIPLTGDQTLVFGLGAERLQGVEGDNVVDEQIANCYIGDFNITSTGGLQNNVIEANVAIAKFLNEKDISMILYDMESYSYKNGILMGNDLTIRTQNWGVEGGVKNIVQKGVCWKTSTGPIITDSHTNDGVGFPAFSSTLTNLLRNTTYFVRAYYKDGNGTVSYGNELSFTTELLQIGDFHEGGIIFYFLQPDDFGYDPLIRKGLIAATQDQGKPTFWASLNGGGSSIIGDRYEIGYGMANSILMDDDYKTSPYAVASCFDYSTGIDPDIYTDWYLPSHDEQIQMFLQKDLIGGFKAEWYHNSNEAGSAFCYPMDFGNYKGRKYASVEDRFDTWKKNNYMNVRAIRSFVET